MNILITFTILLLAAKLGGFFSKKIGLSAIIGEVFAGVLIGPYLFNLLQPNAFIESISWIGVALLMFVVGLEFNIKSFEKYLKGSILTAVFGAFVPFFAGFAFDLDIPEQNEIPLFDFKISKFELSGKFIDTSGKTHTDLLRLDILNEYNPFLNEKIQTNAV